MGSVRGHHEQDAADLDDRSRRACERGDRACVRGRDLHHGLSGLDLDDQLVDFNVVAYCDVPREDLGLGKTFPDVR
jgi:hypothetical protein